MGAADHIVSILVRMIIRSMIKLRCFVITIFAISNPIMNIGIICMRQEDVIVVSVLLAVALRVINAKIIVEILSA